MKFDSITKVKMYKPIIRRYSNITLLICKLKKFSHEDIKNRLQQQVMHVISESSSPATFHVLMLKQIYFLKLRSETV